MNYEKFRKTGESILCSVAEEKYKAFVPVPLPPKPALNVAQINDLLSEASAALGRLDSMAGFLPDIDLFIYLYVRKEVLLSSQIEGTPSSFSDLLIYENASAPGVPVAKDVQDVSNYVAALNHGLERIRGGFPLSLRLIREIHEILLSKGRGSTKCRVNTGLGSRKEDHIDFGFEERKNDRIIISLEPIN